MKHFWAGFEKQAGKLSELLKKHTGPRSLGETRKLLARKIVEARKDIRTKEAILPHISIPVSEKKKLSTLIPARGYPKAILVSKK